MMLQLTGVINVLPRKLKTLSSGFALGGLMLLAIGCEFANAEEARIAIQDVREVRQVQDLEITPRLDALETLRQDEILPREQQIQRLSREVQSLYRVKILPLQSGTVSVSPDTTALSTVLEELDDKTRKLRDRSDQLDKETQLRFNQLENDGSSVRFEQERIFREKQDAIRRLFQQIDDAHNSAERRLNALYSERQAIENKLNRMPTESFSPDRLRDMLDTVNSEIRNLEDQVRSEVNEIEGLVSSTESEILRLQRIVDEQRRDIDLKNRELDRLFTEMNDIYQSGPEVDHLYRQLQEIQDAIASAEFTDVDALRDELRVVEQEIVNREDQFHAEVAELQTLLADIEVAARQLSVELADMEADLSQRKADLDSLYVELDRLRAAGSGLDALHQRQREINAELNTASADTTRDSSTLASNDLQGELWLVEQQIAGGEAEHKARIAGVEEEIAHHQAEINRLQRVLADDEGALQTKHRMINDLQEKLDNLNATGSRMEDLYQLRKDIERKLTDVVPVDIAALKRELASIQEQITKLETGSTDRLSEAKRKISSLEDEVAKLQRTLAENERDLFAKKDMVNDLRQKVESTNARGGNRLNDLYAERKELEHQLDRTPFDYVDPALLRPELDTFNLQIARVEDQRYAENDKLERLIRDLEDEMYAMDRDLQDQERVRQRDFEDVESQQRDSQSQLENQRTELEDQMRREFIDRQVDAENARLEVSERIAFIMDEEVRPLEEQIKALELELEGMYDRERALQLELRELKAQLGDAEREVETRILDLLEDTLSSFTDESLDPTSDAPTADVPTTDAAGRTLAPLTPVQ